MHPVLLEITVIFWGIILLTMLQKYHFKMLYYLAHKYHHFLRYIIKFIIRTWVIIHECSHLLFWILSGAKIKKIELFRKDGGRVTFQTKNYIWHLAEYYDRPWFIFQLFLNQIGIFLTSIGPLLVWIIGTYILLYILSIDIEQLTINNFYGWLHWQDYIILVIYAIIIPSFLLSFQDIKNFIISHQTNLGSTIVWSIINTIIFFCFLWFLTFFYDFFLFFGIFYIGIFIIFLAYFSLNMIYFKFVKKFFKKSLKN
jgi:hypothetical protein